MTDLEERTCREDEFYRTALQARSAVASDSGLLRRIGSVFAHQYIDPEKNPLADGVTFLGKGSFHALYGVGSMPAALAEGETFLALRIRTLENVPRKDTGRYSYKLSRDAPILAREAALFEAAHSSGERTPRFYGIVAYGDLAGLLVEDLSERGRYSFQGIDLERFLRRETGEVFLLDPNEDIRSCDSERGRKYLDEGMRIDVPLPNNFLGRLKGLLSYAKHFKRMR